MLLALIPALLLTVHDVAVIDVITGRIIPHQDIVIRGDRITAVHNAGTRGKQTRYAIPGLWDMHARPSSHPERYLANGVTGIRVWKAEIAKESGNGPRIYSSGVPLEITTPQQAREAFERYYDPHVDFIDVTGLSSAAFEALAEASRHGGIPFAGDLPATVSPFVAAEDRMVSMEHLSGLGNEDNNSLWQTFRRYDVRQTPILSSTSDPAALRLTGAMAKAGVAILAGTDSGDPLALHKELALLVKAGLTPAQALRAATSEPARLMHREKELGQVKTGYAADLVILKANPLADIGNTRRIESVIVRGRRIAQ